MMAINAAIAGEAAARPWVRFIDIAPMFADEQGGYTAFRPDKSGEMVRVRQEDGTHLTRVATNWVAERVYGEMKKDWAIVIP
jgi:hypothetical protein